MLASHSIWGKKTQGAIRGLQREHGPDVTGELYEGTNAYSVIGTHTSTPHEQGLHQEIEDHRQSIRMNPYDAEVYNNLGVACGKLGYYQEAVEAFQQAIKLNPYNALAHCNLGVAYVNLNRNREAIEAYMHAIRIQPHFALVHYNLGLAYLLTGNTLFAFEQYKVLRNLDEDLANRFFNLIHPSKR
jgi:tetratricopeptide (TPR) repeat protein